MSTADEKLAAVMNLHYPFEVDGDYPFGVDGDPDGPFCAECGAQGDRVPWPCRTAIAAGVNPDA